MDFSNIEEEIEEPVEKTKNVVKRIPGMLASYNVNLKEFKLHCPVGCQNSKYVSIQNKDTYRCKGCNSELSKTFIGRIKDILEHVNIDSKPVAMYDENGEEFGFQVFTKNHADMEFRVAFKRCAICRNKKVYAGMSKPKDAKKGQSFYTRCGCGVRTYENLGNAKYFTDSFNDTDLEALFATI